jgi:chromosome segregation ATPase
VEDKIKALEELGAKNPGSRSVIEKQAVALNKSLVDMQRSFASIQEKYDLAKHAANSLNDGIKAVEGKMAQTKETIGNIKGEIKQVQTALTKLKNDKADHAGANNINVQTDDLLAQLHGKSPVFSKVH